MNRGHAATPPAVAPPGPWRFPVPEPLDVGGDVEVRWFPRPGQHVVAATLVLPLPLDVEPREAEGVATLGARTLDEGTRARPGTRFAERLESVGAAFGVAVTASGWQVQLDVPGSHLGEALALLLEAVATPELSEVDLLRQRSLRLAEIEQLSARSAATANRMLRRALWTPDSRLHRMVGGEPGTVAGIEPDQVRDFHLRHVLSARPTLVLAGDPVWEPAAAVAAALAGWPSGPRVEPTAPRPTTAAAPTCLLVERPGAVQADLRLAGPGIDRHDRRWSAFLTAATVLGGSFLSRLNRVLREERGYTYGVDLSPSPLHRGGTWTVSGSFRTEVVGQTLAELPDLLDPAADPLRPEEVAAAVAQLRGTIPMRSATAGGVVDQVAAQQLAGLGVDHVDRVLAELDELDVARVQAVAEELVGVPVAAGPAGTTLVVVGDAERLAPVLTAAGYRPTVVAASP